MLLVLPEAPSGGSDLGRFSFGSPSSCTLWRGRLAWQGGRGGHQAPTFLPLPASLPVSPPFQALRNFLPFFLCYDNWGLMQQSATQCWIFYLDLLWVFECNRSLLNSWLKRLCSFFLKFFIYQKSDFETHPCLQIDWSTIQTIRLCQWDTTIKMRVSVSAMITLHIDFCPSLQLLA